MPVRVRTLLAIALFIAACGSPTTIVTAPASSPPAAVAVTASPLPPSRPPTTPSPHPDGRFAWGDPLAGDTFATISATGLEAARGGLLVFGTGAAGPVVVSSSDGQHWNEAPLGADAEEVVAAAAFEGTWIVVCRNLDKMAAVGQIWRSDDRQAWSMVLELRDGELFDVEATADGFMVVGYPDRNAPRYQATVWHSGDGLTWEPEELAAEVAFEIERLSDGRAAIATKGRRLTVWLGDRGRWSPARVAGDGLVSSLVAGPGAIVLAGSLFDEEGASGPARLWRSPDGASWERVDQTVAERVHVETATGSEFVGWEYVEGDAAALWTSEDGLDWAPEPRAPFRPGLVSGMAYRDGVVYALAPGPQGGTALWAGTVVSP